MSAVRTSNEDRFCDKNFEIATAQSVINPV